MLQATVHEPAYADPHEVADFASTLPVSYLHCRDVGHNWQDWTAHKIPGGFERAFMCSSCKTQRWEVLTLTGAKVKGHYVYPDDYLLQGLGRIVGDGRDALRLESVSRVATDKPLEGENQ